jgi:RHS repeat-associated protein
MTDTTGYLKQRYVYDVWGQRIQSVPAPKVDTLNKYGYTGEALDPGSSLYYLRARYYDPAIGRFINRDPFPGFDRLPQSLNRFVYVRNNPGTLTDRTGYFDDDTPVEGLELLWPFAPLLP